MNCDVLIVGGGIAGLSLAWQLAPVMSVVLVEAEETLAFHTSSRSARQMQPSYGPESVMELTRRSIALVGDISASLEHPILKPRPLIFIGEVPEIAQLVWHNTHLRPLSREVTMAMNPELVPEAFGAACLDDTAMEVDVPALLEFYRAGAVEAGAVIVTGAPVRSGADVGERWIVQAGEHTVDASTVVNAAGAWADSVAAMFGARPLGLAAYRRSAAIVTTAEAVNPLGAMVGAADDTFYYRPEGDNLLISPCESVPAEPGDAQVVDADIDRLIETLNRVMSLEITGVVRAWAGLRTSPADGLPVVGFDAHVPGFFWLAGQGGYGIQTSAAMAEFAAGVITDETATADAWLEEALSPQRPALA